MDTENKTVTRTFTLPETPYLDRKGYARRHCGICGKPLAGKPKQRVHFIQGGMNVIIRPDAELSDAEESGDMGYWEVGNTCANLVPKEFLIPAREK